MRLVTQNDSVCSRGQEPTVPTSDRARVPGTGPRDGKEGQRRLAHEKTNEMLLTYDHCPEAVWSNCHLLCSTASVDNNPYHGCLGLIVRVLVVNTDSVGEPTLSDATVSVRGGHGGAWWEEKGKLWGNNEC